ncbi:MAG: hypothetical protein ACE5FW_01235, partial [Candidatus Aenigmatarchaeota archaeon]
MKRQVAVLAVISVLLPSLALAQEGAEPTANVVAVDPINGDLTVPLLIDGLLALAIAAFVLLSRKWRSARKEK